MKIIYTRIAAAAALETGIIANPDYYENPNLKAKEVIIYGNYPKIQKDYESLEVPVEVRKLEEPQKTTLATVNVAVGITPELQAVMDDASFEDLLERVSLYEILENTDHRIESLKIAPLK